MRLVAVPDAVRHDLVEAEAQFGATPTEGQHELRVQERLAAGEAEDADAERVGIFQEAQGHRDIEPIRPFNRHAAMRAAQVTLICAGKGQVIRPKRPRAADGTDVTPAAGLRESSGPG